MDAARMHLRVLLPFRVFVEEENVLRIVAETSAGSLGLLPHRLDCTAALMPGILTYETTERGEVHLAVDEGVLLKCGPEVTISVRNAIGGADLGKLREAVEREFLDIDEREKGLRSVLAKLEGGLVRRLLELKRE